MGWNYAQPVEILFKTGGIAEIGTLCEMRGWLRGILVCDPFFVQNGLAETVCTHANGRIVKVYSDITPNPRVGEVDAVADLLRETGADFAVALGGGSAIDCAKTAAAVAAGNKPVAAYHTGSEPLPGKSVPLIAAPSTAGTGSEVTCVAVLTDGKKGVKSPLMHRNLYPKTAIIDPALTLSLPPAVTASTGLDALSHALEAFWSRGHQPICDALALAAARLVFEYLPRVYKNGADLEAREKMSEASVLAGLAFSLPKTAAAHAISFPLTHIYGMPHGEACAFTLDSLCTINAPAEGGRLDIFARELGFTNAGDMGEAITGLKRQTGMRLTLGEAGIQPESLPELCRLSRHPNLDNNPVSLDDSALMALFSSKC